MATTKLQAVRKPTDSIAIDARRLEYVDEAIQQIDAIGAMLGREAKYNGEDMARIAAFAARRIRELTSVVLGLGLESDEWDEEDYERMRRLLYNTVA